MTRSVQFKEDDVAANPSSGGSYAAASPWKFGPDGQLVNEAAETAAPAESASAPPPRVTSSRLYVSGIAASVTVKELESMFVPFHPTSISVSSDLGTQTTRGYVDFRTVRDAEMAHAILGNLHLKQHTCTVTLSPVELPVGAKAPEPTVGILMIKYLPKDADNFTLFEIFREVGPLYLCRIGLSETNEAKDFAVVRYYTKADSERAIEELNFGCYKGSTIAIVDFEPKDRKAKAEGKQAAGGAAGAHRRAPSRASALSPTPDDSLRRAVSPGPVMATPTPSNSINTALNSTAPTPAPGATPAPTIRAHTPAPAAAGPGGLTGLNPRKLFIKNLHATVSHTDLFAAFKAYGYIHTARINIDEATNKSKGTGVVTFSTPEDAAKALNAMNGKEIKGKTITIVYFDASAAAATGGAGPVGLGIQDGANDDEIDAELQAAQQRRRSDTITARNASPAQIETTESVRPDSAAGESVESSPSQQPQQQAKQAAAADATLNRRFLELLSDSARNEVLTKHITSKIGTNPAIDVEDAPVVIPRLAALDLDEILAILADPELLADKFEELRVSPAPAVASETASRATSPSSENKDDGAEDSKKEGRRRRNRDRRRASVVENDQASAAVTAAATAPVAPSPTPADESVAAAGSKKSRRNTVRVDKEADKPKLPPPAAEPKKQTPKPASPAPQQQPPAAKAPTPAPPASAPTPPPAPVQKNKDGQPVDPETEAFIAMLLSVPEGQRKQKLGSKLFPLIKGLGVKDPTKVTVRILDNTTDIERLAYALKDPIRLQAYAEDAHRSLNK